MNSANMNTTVLTDATVASNFGIPVNTRVVLDGFGNPILYFPANGAAGLPTGHFKSYGADGGTGKSQNGKIDYSADDFFSPGVAP